MSSTPFQSRQPRRGQALLLAVLIMIFAALLSASFIAVVSVNLNQTARQTDKNRSIVAAKAGIDYARRQLAYSDEGSRWSAELENVPPDPNDVDYAFYYTPMEIAQGWARTTPHPTLDLDNDGKFYDGANLNTIDPGDERIALARTRDTTGKLELVKSPDPRNQGNLTTDAPTFLSQVTRVPLTLQPGNPEFDKAGSLKITSIGLSSEDPTAYTRSVAYFGGYNRAPVAQTMRTVGNWDFVNNVVPSAQVAGYDAATLSITLRGVNGIFPQPNAGTPASDIDPPFIVTIGGPRTPTLPVRKAVVIRRVGNVLTLAQALTPQPDVNERIELAANLGAPQGISYSNDATLVPLTGALQVRLSDSSANNLLRPNEVDGARVNGGLIWSGSLATTKLREYNRINDPAEIASANSALPPGSITAPLAPGSIQSSGLMVLEDTTVRASVSIDRIVSGGNAGQLQTSNAGGIFQSGANYQLVNDGWNGSAGRVGVNSSNIRAVGDFRPPVLDRGEDAERYRNLARFSKPYDDGNMLTPPLRASSSLDGYGEGIYIDNVQDKEKKTATTGPIPTEMTQAEFVKMLIGSPTGAASISNYERTGAPITPLTPPTYANASLEEQHLRGWVGPDEFRARGVEIELVTIAGVPMLIITRDPRDDNRGVTANALGPVAVKAWKNFNDGTATNDGTLQPGIYRKALPWPTNGVIFAEGNVRIKGVIANAPRSLTVVSMNNIYIEDSVSITNRKLLLLAKKNVVMNPTRVLGRPDAQTVSTDTSPVAIAVGGTATLTVADTSDFRRREVVETSTITGNVEMISSVGQITDILSPTSMTVEIASAPLAQIAAASIVRTRREKSPTVATTTPFRIIGGVDDATQRRFTLPAASTSLRLAFNQSGDRKPAMKVETEGLPGNTKPAAGTFLTNKRVLDAATPPTDFLENATIIAQANKRIRGDYALPTPGGNDTFPTTAQLTAITDETLAQAQTLTVIKATMEGPPGEHPNLAPPPLNGWKYKVTVDPTYLALPFFYLAGVGNRYDFGAAPTVTMPYPPGLVGWSANIANSDIAANAYDVPVATSIGLWVNSTATTTVPSLMRNENYDATAMDYDQTRAFGFDPNFLDAATPNLEREDVLTADQGFYQTLVASAPVRSTLDSRSVGNLPAGQNYFTLKQNTLPNAAFPALLPDYRLLGIKLEDVALTTGASTTNTIKPSHVFNVNAFVYAQTGSWLVIPGPIFESRLHGDDTKNFFDLTTPAVTPAVADPNEYLDSNNNDVWDTGEYADLNRNGINEDSEKYAVTRYSRFNYTINFTGAIAENQTAIVNDAGTGPSAVKGAVNDWMTKWATTTFDSTAATQITNDRIRYVFDSDVVRGKLDDDPATDTVDETDYGFRLPQIAEVFGVS